MPDAPITSFGVRAKHTGRRLDPPPRQNRTSIDGLRTLDDQLLREELATLMTTDYTVFEKELFTDYREYVRKVIPEDVQDAIRVIRGERSAEASPVPKPPVSRVATASAGAYPRRSVQRSVRRSMQ